MQYRFILEPYKGAATRHDCKACEGKKEFTKYFDTENEIEFPSFVGKCNRLNCGNHVTPKMYFEANPSLLSNEMERPQRPMPVVKPVNYIPYEKMQASLIGYAQNSFVRGLYQRFEANEVVEAIEKYNIGTSKHWQGATVFWQVDILGKVRQAKVIPYNFDTLKRIKKDESALKFDSKTGQYIDDRGTDKIWFAGKTILKNYDANLCQCFFGEHLLSSLVEGSKVQIVESEKTAVVCSMLMPQFTWLATGGSNGCRWTDASVNKVLRGFDVVLFPDNDAFDKWTERAESLNKQGLMVRVSALLKQRRPDQTKCDLADALLPKGYPSEWDILPTASEIALMAEVMKSWKPTAVPINHDAEMITEAEILSWNL